MSRFLSNRLIPPLSALVFAAACAGAWAQSQNSGVYDRYDGYQPQPYGDPGQAAQMWHSGRRLKSAGQGLAIVHSVVTRHGGSVSLESQPGMGTTFHLCFPILEDARI